MNKKVKGAALLVTGLFLMYLLINKNGIESAGSIDGGFLLTLLNFITLFLGKMAWYIGVACIACGVVLLIRKDVEIGRGRIFALIAGFLALSLLLIRRSATFPLPDSFTDAGSYMLELGFNRESGGFLGGLLGMAFYRFMEMPMMETGLILIVLMCMAYMLKDVVEYWFNSLRSLFQYYRSDEYREKAELLKAKRKSEKLKRTDYKRYQKEEMKKRIAESRNQKLSFELSKKPKEKFTDRTEVYSEEELAEKKKEWTEFSQRVEKKPQERGMTQENEKDRTISTEGQAENGAKFGQGNNDDVKVDNPEIINGQESQNKDLEDIKKVDNTGTVVKASLDNGKVNAGTSIDTATGKPSMKKKENFLKYIEIDKQKEADKEKIPKGNGTAEEDGEKYSDILPLIPKIEAFEDVEAIERERRLEEEIRRTESSAFNMDSGYNELLKKSIEEIFKIKPMDLEKKFEIEKAIIDNVSHLENVLKQFGIDAKVVNYEYGPTITRYEITIPAGVKVSKVTGLSDDIAMNLAAESIRIEAPIPGKNTIGIETPNKVKEPVYFANIIKNGELEKGELNVILGKDIVGRDKIIDITKMPHLLIAGQTGSGKSVAVNTLISTLISKKSEKEVRFIMIDPKMVELMPYNGIPHLLVPVIIDPQQAAIALKWAVNEMEGRYRQLMENGVRNIKGYNSLKYVEKMPYIVVIIDELADLMMVASGSVEESIARIAQKARAVGIHLVVATQRPSTDVITGMIKANLPSRISFALRSQIDSRTILDSGGAEKLLGQGDMLLLENGSSKLERIQGAFISDEEVVNLTATLKSNAKAVYREEILTEAEEDDRSTDPYFENAVEIIRQEKKVSISLLQRELRIGFNRASRIYEQLKEKGIISYDNQILIDDDLENEIKK